ncbi:hypothetical protein [Actinomadura citrea]|uniref:Uncharacterized protein n=1 Tax=Actinomadura citrea TaxID=46158 RepID=A0A7Y9KHP8_9ACTN|nr:hypothetical protein [Actinomadura citrea]NYE17796.1 hypothetical protein [Actinomadura citrea]GGT61566.1 hypothetical protein GCM10010177_17970 [Actinomadura citrea]
MAVTTAYFQDTLRAVAEGWLTPGEVADSVSAGDAIRVVDIHHDLDTGNDILVPAPKGGGNALSARDAPPDSLDEEWLAAHGAIDVGSSRWEITVETRRNEDVEIVDVRPVLAAPRCGPAPSGALVTNQAAGGGDKIALYLVIDGPRPRPVFQRNEGGRLSPFFVGSKAQRVTLEKGRKETLAIVASIGHPDKSTGREGPYCQWSVQVDYIAGGGRHGMSIRAPGNRLFALTGTLPDVARYQAVFLDGLTCARQHYTKVSASKYAGLLKASSRLECP